MSLPHPPGDPMAPPVPRTVPMPATPGSPLEPLRAGRRLDRRHWLLAGLLGILGGGLLLDGVVRVVSLAANPQAPADQLLHPIATGLLGLVAVIVAFAFAPGGGARRALGVVVVLVGVGLAAGFGYAMLGGVVRIPLEVRWVVSVQSLLVGTGILGWLLASGARWWSFLVLLLAPLVATLAMALVLQGTIGALSGSTIALGPYALALVLALLALALSIPRRR